jgi:two-component system NtrC family sensor kinase
VAAAAKPEGLVVAIVGEGTDSRSWASVLEARGFRVVHGQELSALLPHRPVLTLIFSEPKDAPKTAGMVAGLPSPPPVTLFLGPLNEEHPHTRFVHTLIEAKREWEGTFDAIVDPVALVDGGGLLVRANLGLARVLGCSIRDIISSPYRQVLGEPRPGLPDPIALSLADGRPRTEETRFTKLEGTLQVTTSPLLGEADGRRGLVVILKDVSEFKENQERLLQAVRLADVGQLAAGVAHEINTPLASMALRAESLLQSAQDPRLLAIDSFKNFPRYLKTIDEEIFRCKKIIGALLDFSRSRKPEVRITDLNALAERATELVDHQMRLKQVALSLRLDPDLRHIEADDGQIRQVLIALLMNALDATSAGGHVVVETRAEGEQSVCLSVTDDGVGIPTENLPKIFSPFFTTKPIGQGTGLGLAVCHGIVAAHGGEIRVESEVGRGTRFAMILPTSRKQAGDHG